MIIKLIILYNVIVLKNVIIVLFELQIRKRGIAVKKTQSDYAGSKKIIGEETAELPAKQSFVVRVITKVTIALAVIACIAMTVYLQSSVAEKQKKYEQLQEQIDDLEVKNEELNLTLNSSDIESYMEKLAIEKYGYAYPDEVRFYDKSHN